ARLRQDRLEPPDAADARLSARHCARACLLQAVRFANAHARAWAIGSALRRLFIAGHDAAATRMAKMPPCRSPCILMTSACRWISFEAPCRRLWWRWASSVLWVTSGLPNLLPTCGCC